VIEYEELEGIIVKNESDKNLKQEQFILAMITVAEKLPQDLTDHYTVDELVTGIQYVDFILGRRKIDYDSLVTREKTQDPTSANYEFTQELKKFVARELKTYFDIAENFETALRRMDYVYGYETNMPDVSAIIMSHVKNREL